jgi:hypothetical protein
VLIAETFGGRGGREAGEKEREEGKRPVILDGRSVSDEGRRESDSERRTMGKAMMIESSLFSQNSEVYVASDDKLIEGSRELIRFSASRIEDILTIH